MIGLMGLMGLMGRIGRGAAVCALLALACGCRGEAAAQSGSAAAPAAAAQSASAPAAAAKLAIPASWRELPEVVHAVDESLAAAKLLGAQVAAWGDPARGCYAIQLAAKERGRHVAQMEAGLRKGFGAPPAPATGSAAAGSTGSASPASPATKPAAANPSSAELTLSLEKPMPGSLRARIRDDGESTRLAAAVCFFHARYPEQCRRHCERALASLEAP